MLQWTGKNLIKVISLLQGKPDLSTDYGMYMWESYCDIVEKEGLKINGVLIPIGSSVTMGGW